MRITGGQIKGRLLASPKGVDIRPSSDQVREAIFNIIGQDLWGLRVLDLFAGTGSLGLEALSRGAAFALFIDNSRKAFHLIKKNLALCGYHDLGAVLTRDLKNRPPLARPQDKEPFDLVFLDPPYGKGFIPHVLRPLSSSKVLSQGSRVVAESSKTEVLPVSVGNLAIIDTRLYGDTKVSIYSYEAKK